MNAGAMLAPHRAALLFAICLAFRPDLTPATGAEPSSANPLPDLIRLYDADRQNIGRFYDLSWSKERHERLERHLGEWTARLRSVAFASLDSDAQVDYLLLRNDLTREQARLKLQQARRLEMEPLLPFMGPIHALEIARLHMEKLDPAKAAEIVSTIPTLARSARQAVEQARKKKEPAKSANPPSPGGLNGKGESDSPSGTNTTTSLPAAISPTLAQRTAAAVQDLAKALKAWAGYYDGFLPEFGWWLKKPQESALSALDDYAKFLREEIAGSKGKEEDPLIGDPIGAAALKDDLVAEWLAWSAEDLLAIGERELAWCEAEMKKASPEMGLGTDWKAALARVKDAHAAPGQQDQIVTEEARFAIDFVKSRDLVTVPPLCEELWRTAMLSTEGQKTLPFAAYSGPSMLVAFARDDMKHEDKVMAMRGNNRHFTRIVTPHELIPGHHLEAFMTARYRDYRRPFRTPFFVEGWALYWEMQLWNLGYGRTPEERIGMLFWRMHRCARIIVSLKFHLGQMSPDQMVNFIVDRVGHERLGATSEVRRFIGGAYSPLYQCAYMIGGLQLKALHDQLVPSRMTTKQFNDAVLQMGAIPIELVRASLVHPPLGPDAMPSWRPGTR